jgi:hypothetical protein
MALIKTFMLAQAFEELVRHIYQANGFAIIEQARAGKDRGFDFLMKSQVGETIAVEVKVSRSSVIPRGEIVRMLDQLNRAMESSKADRGLLVIGGSIAIPLHDTGKAEVVDLQKLAELTAAHPRLSSELDSILRELTPMPVGDFERHRYAIFGDAHIGFRPEYLTEPQLSKGQQLAAALKAVPAGKKGAREFETKCFDALQYIFETDFSNWSKQKVTDGGISRYDVIARISSGHDFWRSIVAYFRSWYVIFEFKNFSQKISQGQVFTTERYLFVGAMRTVAFIVSRKGADKNALAVTRGAVRDSGKLIIHLSLDDIFKMLDMKDNSDDPNGFLFDHLDDMLMRLER